MAIEQKMKKRIKKATESDKVGSVLKSRYNKILESDNPKLLEEKVGCLAQAKDNKFKSKEVIFQIYGKLYGLYTTYKKLLDHIESDKFIYFGT